ncbi:MAG: hypothetical protein KDA50_00400 [Rhodobacteraceae bacterium]|nr:hypothetical protein [Paracoccaceae bacterium]
MKTRFWAASLVALGLASGAQAAPTQYGGTGNWYDVVFASITWTQAKAAAQASVFKGVQGYLVTVTSAGEQGFINTLNPNSAQLWIGATDEVTEGQWVWDGGPEAGQLLSATYSNWSAGEPNNAGGEDYAVGWWSGDRWNDLPNLARSGYVVEWSPAPVPLPASLPLAVGALGLLAMVRRRKG